MYFRGKRSRGMAGLIRNSFLSLSCLVLLSCFLNACSPAGKIKGRRSESLTQASVLSLDMQRKYNYYFLEAARLKAKGQYDAAFDLYKHCLAIQPDAPSALYEISQFYLYL